MKKGFLLLDALIALTIIGVIVAALFPSLGFLLLRQGSIRINTAANLLVQEGNEAVYSILSTDWNAYPDGTYILARDEAGQSPHWTLISGDVEVLEAKYSRTIQLESIRRDPQTFVQDPSGVLDPESRRITTTVQWDDRGEPLISEASLVLFDLNTL